MAGIGLLLLGAAAMAEGRGASLQLPAPWQAALSLGGVSLGFWAIVLARPDHWWAVFPGTLLAITGGALLLGPLSPHHVSGGVFLSLAGAFGLCYVLGQPHPQVLWAIYPAAVTVALGGLLLIDQAAIGMVLVLVALAIGVVTLRPRRSVPSAPDTNSVGPTQQCREQYRLPRFMMFGPIQHSSHIHNQEEQ